MLAVVLALGSSAAWGVSDFIGGIKSRSNALLSVLLLSQATALVVLAAIVLVRSEAPPDGAYLLRAAVAGLGEVVAVAALYRGFAVGVISIVAPLAAAAPVVPLLMGMVIGEVPALVEGAGLMLALAGLVLTSIPRGAAPRRRRPASILYGTLAALGFGAFFVAMDGASHGSVPWALFVAKSTAVAAIAIVALVMRSRPVVRRADLPGVMLIGVLIVLGDAMYAGASTVGLLGVVAVLSALHPIATIGLARLYLDERIARLQQIGIATALAGVVAITAF